MNALATIGALCKSYGQDLTIVRISAYKFVSDRRRSHFQRLAWGAIRACLLFLRRGTRCYHVAN